MNRPDENASETDTNVQKPKTCGLAKASTGLVLGGLLSVVFIFIVTVYLPESKLTLALYRIAALFLIVCSVTSPVLGITSIYKIIRSKGRQKGVLLAIGGVLIPVVFIVLVVMSTRAFLNRMFCVRNLEGLAIAIRIYASDNDGQYPTADKWYDLLIKHADVSEKQFRCPMDKNGPYSYVINPDCEPNSSADVVLLFETKGGWNQHGGAEVLTFGNHGGNGCNVLFNDGHVEFITPDKVGKLKWKAKEDKNDDTE